MRVKLHVEMKHSARIEAEKKVSLAKADFHTAERRVEAGEDESLLIDADGAWKNAIAELVAAEMAHPTAREITLRANRIRLENRGLMS